MIINIVIALLALAACAAGGLYAMRQLESFMVLMDRLYNPPGTLQARRKGH